MDTKDLPARWYKLYSNGGLSVSFKWSDDAYNGPADIYICPFADKEVPMAKNGAVSYFKAKGNTVASGPATVGNHLTEYPGGQVLMEQEYMWFEIDLPTQLTTRSISVEGQAVEAVLDVRPFVSDCAYTIHCVRFLHWFQDGFQVRCGFRCVGPDKVNDIDEKMLSKLTFTNVSLAQSIK